MKVLGARLAAVALAAGVVACGHPEQRIVDRYFNAVRQKDNQTLQSFADSPERWLDVAWEHTADDPNVHVGRLHLVVANSPGSLGSLSTIIGKSEGNISNLKITNRSIDFFEMMIDVEVKNVKHLTNIIAALRATPVINSVERARG